MFLIISVNWPHWGLWRLEYFWGPYQGWRCCMGLQPRDGQDLTAAAVGKDAFLHGAVLDL